MKNHASRWATQPLPKREGPKGRRRKSEVGVDKAIQMRLLVKPHYRKGKKET